MASTKESIQGFLNSLSSAPGSILYRDTLEWQGLAPGQAGQVLTLDKSLRPGWSGTPNYRPAWMEFPTSNDYYKGPLTTAGNVMTAVGRFQIGTRPGVIDRYLTTIYTTTVTTRRLNILMMDTAHPTFPRAFRVIVGGAPATVLANFIGPTDADDDQPHSFLFTYDTAAQDGVLIVDGVEYGPQATQAGTVNQGSQTMELGQITIAPGRAWDGQISFFGYADELNDNYYDFFDENDNPLQPDMSTWSQWAAQPKVWNEAADLARNYGSAANLTRHGTPIVALIPPV